MDGGHFDLDDIKNLKDFGEEFKGFDNDKQIDILRKVNVMYGENHNIPLDKAYVLARDGKSQCETTGGAKKNKGSTYITESTKISQSLVKDFKIAYKPAIMQKCLSAFRKHSKASDAVGQLKDAEKYIREHKDEFIKMYDKEVKDAEEKKKKKSKK